MRPAVLYLHGFASSPGGQKALAVREALSHHEIDVVAPDLNIPSFEKLDFDAMVGHALATAEQITPSVVVGSSLGALVALEVVGRGPRVSAVLIAPALGISEFWTKRIPPGDPILVYNYARAGEAPIHRAFFEQMQTLTIESTPPPTPVTIFMGRKDESVPFERVRRTWDSWESSGRLLSGSRFLEIEEGDHGLVSYADQIAEAILQEVQRTKGIN